MRTCLRTCLRTDRTPTIAIAFGCLALLACGNGSISKGGNSDGGGGSGAGGQGGGKGGGGGMGGGSAGGGGSGTGGSGGGTGGGGGGGSGGGSGGVTHPPMMIPKTFECVTCAYSPGPIYTQATDMCDYLNAFRAKDQELDAAVKGCSGGTDWAIPFLRSPEADSIAQEEAERVAAGGKPKGRDEVTGSGSLGYEATVLYADDATSPSAPLDVTFTSHQGPTEGKKPAEAYCPCVFDTTLAYIRIYFRMMTCKGTLPVGKHLGCGAAVDKDGKSVWRTVKFLP